MVYRVKEAFSFDDPQGVPVTLRVGALLEANDPRVKGHERYLEPAETAAARTAGATETATAAPGERRTVTSDSEVAELRRRASDAGVAVDHRWGPAKLRQAIADATKTDRSTDKPA